jgi:beta-glucosidase
MKRRSLLSVGSGGILALALLAGPAVAALPYQDARLPVDARVQDLLQRMTPTEKFWQLFMLAGSLEDGPQKYADGAFGFQIGASQGGADAAAYVNGIQRHFVEETRLGIPIIAFAEALHGLVREDATVFPQAIGLAATFDTALVRDVSGAIAEECRAAGIRMVLSPVVNIASDVRWGRVEETYGEDPYLSSEMGVAFVSEFERRGVVTTPKHFIANVGDGGRDSYPIHWNERLLREIYLPPFAACVQRGGSRAVMTAYNSLDGTPCSANGWLNNLLLRQDLGYTGITISDACAVGGALVLHFTAADYAEATEQALEGGLDVIFQTSFDHAAKFLPAFLDGRIPPEVIDRAVARVLRVKFELGLFDRPYVTPADAAGARSADVHRDLARRAARESIVLLKNEKRTLPLSTGLGTIAVLGPDAAEARLGGYSGPGRDTVSILDGIQRRIGANRVRYARGCARLDPQFETVPSQYLICARGDTVSAGLRGEYFDNVTLAGEPVFARVDPQLQFQWTLFSPDPRRLAYDFYSVRWTGRLKGPADGTFRIGIDGNDGYRLYIDDELVIDNWRKATRRSVLADYDFERDRLYDLRVEYFEPTGNAWVRLVWNAGMPAGADAEMDEAVSLVAASDAAIVVAGLEEGEFRDRAYLALPGRQEELIQRVAATGKPVAVVLVGGSATTMSRWLDAVPAVLAVWYPGEAGGDAVADVLFGDANPAGRLPITFPVAEGQLPLVYNHKPTGRGDDYLDVTGQPLFPFGYGLSYTTFEYRDLVIAKPSMRVTDSTTVRCTVRNTGTIAGDEVVQLYVHDELASVARPLMELKGFARVHLAPEEAREVGFTITPAMLAMLDRDLVSVVEPGDVRVMIGASSKDIRLRGYLTLVP